MGSAVPVTVLECGPCTVLQVRTMPSVTDIMPSNSDSTIRSGKARPRPSVATPSKVDAEPKRYVREIRQDRSPPMGMAEGPDPHRRTLQRDQERRCHRHEQRPRVHRRHQAPRIQGSSGHSRRQANAPSPRLLRSQRRPGPYPQGDQEAWPTWELAGPRSRTSRWSGST